MRLTTRGRYAVTALLDVAIHADDGPTSIAAIAERQGISRSYLEQLFGRLKRAGLLTSSRGPGGGFRLSEDAADISVSDVIRAVGEGVDATRCGGEGGCQDGELCLTHELWSDLSRQIDDFLAGITIADLVVRSDVVAVASRQSANQRIAARLI